MSAERTELELFLARRLSQPSSEWVGASSNAMVAAALTGTDVDEWDYPNDHADLARCCVTFARAPWHLRTDMLPILRRYCEHAERKYRADDTTEAG